MDASFVPVKTGTNEARTNSRILRQTYSSTPNSPCRTSNDPTKILQRTFNNGTNHVLTSTERNQRHIECTVEEDSLSQSNGQTQNRTSRVNCCSVRSASSPQLTTKPLTRSKVYRKASLKSTLNSLNSITDHSFADRKKGQFASDVRIINISNCIGQEKKVPSEREVDGEEKRVNEMKNKCNTEDVHITCNPLSSPYPYSTPHRNTLSETATEPLDDEPKARSCGSFLPILSLIPQTVISFQYLSPKMKFSWWRNKIS